MPGKSFVSNLSALACALSTLLIASGCSVVDRESAFRMKLPPHPNVSEKGVNVNASAAQPGFCYLVNITAADLETKAKTCYPTHGVASPFSPPLSEIALSVRQGDNRRIELFGYLMKSGETCASLGSGLHEVEAQRLYAMGFVDKVGFKAPDVNVELKAVFPGLSQTYPVMSGLTGCGTPPGGGGAPAITQGGRLKGTRYVVNGALSSGSDSFKQSGSRYKVSSEVKNVSH